MKLKTMSKEWVKVIEKKIPKKETKSIKWIFEMLGWEE